MWYTMKGTNDMKDSNEKTYNMVWKNPFVAQWVVPNGKRVL